MPTDTPEKPNKNTSIEAARTALADRHANGEISDEEFREGDEKLRAQLS